MEVMYFMYAISTLSIVLGFIALLKQKTYIDKNTKQPTEVEVPLLGKFKSNYPALVFVFLGFAASFFAFDKFNKPPGKEAWTIRGSFDNRSDTNCQGKKINWQMGEIGLEPTDLIDGPHIYNNGEFSFRMNIEKGKSFEDVIESIHFTFDSAGVNEINPKPELDSFVSKKKSLLFSMNPHERNYKNVPVFCY